LCQQISEECLSKNSLVRSVGVLGSIISTYTVRAGPSDTFDTALGSVNRGFWIGSVISGVGFFPLRFGYFHFDAAYLALNPMAKAGFPNGDPAQLQFFANFGIPGLDLRPALACLIGVLLAISLNKVNSYYTYLGYAARQRARQSVPDGACHQHYRRIRFWI
jgi:K(+)-stimulated pyrophosphate-energized sodium pump